ncbi:MAG: hypothetical protein Q9187_006016 [Circinaria calcarea]
MRPILHTTVGFLLVCTSQAVHYCPPLGPVFDAPTALSDDPSIRAAAFNLSATLDHGLRNGTIGFNSSITSFSLNLFSIHEAADAPMFQYHHTAPLLNTSAGGTNKVDVDTVYRMGSISKTVTVLELLLHDGKVSFDDPVIKYVPELAAIAAESGTANEIDGPSWAEITVGALTSHLAGIGREFAAGDLTASDLPLTQLGLPALAASDVPTCGRDGSQTGCSRQEFFQGFTKRHPVYAPFATPVYSNAAFWILGYVIETVTGKPYDQAVHDDIFAPLHMNRTSLTKPQENSWGVVPIGQSGWDYDIKGLGAAGGVFTSTNDLSNFCRGILSSTLLSPAHTRRWLKPLAHTTSLRSSVGASWEIIRSASLTPDNRVIDLYTKSGDIGLYHSLMVLVPDFDIALTILTAGDGDAVLTLAAAVLEQFLPLVDGVAKSQTEALYGGKYSSPRASNSSQSSITLKVDAGPGLPVTQWLSDGNDLLAQFSSFVGAEGNTPDMRLYPTGLITKTERAFRAVIRAFPTSGTGAAGESGLLSDPCITWFSIDGLRYGLIAVDDFVFTVAEGGKVTAVEPRVVRQTLMKDLS